MYIDKHLNGDLILRFKIIADSGRSEADNAILTVNNVTIKSLSINFNDRGNTIDQLYRGRFENSNGELAEVSDDKRFYFYIDFVSGYCSIELFAKKLLAEITFNE